MKIYDLDLSVEFEWFQLFFWKIKILTWIILRAILTAIFIFRTRPESPLEDQNFPWGNFSPFGNHWPTMSHNVKVHAKTCRTCQLRKRKTTKDRVTDNAAAILDLFETKIARLDLPSPKPITFTAPLVPRLGETPYLPMQAGPTSLTGVQNLIRVG